MKAQKTVKLSAPILFHEKRITELTFGEPKWQDVEELGAPDQMMRASGMLSIATLPAVISKYAERTIQPMENFPLLLMLPLRDTLAVHEAVLDFFKEARAAIVDSGAASPASSSPSAASA